MLSNGRPCILLQARKLSLRYERQKQLDLTERAFSSQKAVDISKSVCSQDKATYVPWRTQSHSHLCALCAEYRKLSGYFSNYLPVCLCVCILKAGHEVWRCGGAERSLHQVRCPNRSVYIPIFTPLPLQCFFPACFYDLIVLLNHSNTSCRAVTWRYNRVSSHFSAVRLQLSNTLYPSSGQRWFSLERVSLLYNASEEAVFNASEVYAPTSSSYHCSHVSSLQRHSALLLPSNAHALRWAITFTSFQVESRTKMYRRNKKTRIIQKKIGYMLSSVLCLCLVGGVFCLVFACYSVSTST